MRMIAILLAILVCIMIVHRILTFFGLLNHVEKNTQLEFETEFDHHLFEIQTHFPNILFDYECINGFYELHCTQCNSLTELGRVKFHEMIEEMVNELEDEFFDASIDVVYHN